MSKMEKCFHFSILSSIEFHTLPAYPSFISACASANIAPEKNCPICVRSCVRSRATKFYSFNIYLTSIVRRTYDGVDRSTLPLSTQVI